MILPDINVWLALAFDRHQGHLPARAWFAALPAQSQCCFCRYTQRGFLRLATNPQANRLQTQTLSQAWTLYDALMHDPRITYAAEPAGLEAHWRHWTQHGAFSHHVWNDAYLAAFARTGGLELVTFDQGFTQFAGVQITILT